MTLTQTLIHDPVYIRLMLALVVLILFTFGKRFLSSLVINLLSKIKIKRVSLEPTAFLRLKKPLNYLLSVLGIYFTLIASPFVYFSSPSEQFLTLGEWHVRLSIISIGTLHQFFPALFIGLLTWLIYDFEHLYEQFFMELNTKLSLIDNTVFIRYISRIINFVTLALGVAITLVVLIPGFSGIITGVGIGGVAIAYVAKDSLSSMFSGIILLLDKPFVIGDWIIVSDIEGTVEDISFRSTRIRTFDQGLVVIPNNTIGNANIINWSRMEKRRVKFELGVSYDTTEIQMNLLIQKIKNYLKSHSGIEKDTVLVHFISMGDYTLNIQIVYFSLKTDLSSYLALQEEVNLALLHFCEEAQVEIAFPTQTILMPKK